MEVFGRFRKCDPGINYTSQICPVLEFRASLPAFDAKICVLPDFPLAFPSSLALPSTLSFPKMPRPRPEIRRLALP